MKAKSLGLALIAVVVVIAAQSQAQSSDMMRTHCEIIEDCQSCHVRTPVWEVDVIETAPLVDGFDCANCHKSDAGLSPQYLVSALTTLPPAVDSVSCGDINMTTHYFPATDRWTVKVETNIIDLFHLAVWVQCASGFSPCGLTCSGTTECGGLSPASKCGSRWCWSTGSWTEPVFLIENLDMSAGTGPQEIKAYGISAPVEPGGGCASGHDWTYHCCSITITGPPREPDCAPSGCPPMTLNTYLPADGTSETEALLSSITDANGDGVTSGYITVETTAGAISTQDANTSVPGIQVAIQAEQGTGNGEARFNIRAGTTGQEGTVTAKNLSGTTLADEPLTVIQTDLKSVTFSSDHGLMRDNNTDYEATGTVFTEPEWVDGVNNFPISHSMGQNIQVVIEVEVLPPTVPELSFALTGVGPTGANFQQVENLSGGTNQVSLFSTDLVPLVIQKIEGSIAWTSTLSGSTYLSESSGPHIVYVTIDTPRDDWISKHAVTQKRVERAVEHAGAAGSLDPHTIVQHVVQAQGDFDLNGAKANAWEVPDSPSDCQSIIRFAEKVAKMVNVPGTFEHKHIYAIETDPTHGIEVPNTHGGLNQDIRIHQNRRWQLFLVDFGGGINAFEAVGKFTHGGVTKRYAGGTTGVFDNANDVLTVFYSLSWIDINYRVRQNVHIYN